MSGTSTMITSGLSEISKYLTEYSQEVKEELEQAKKETAEEAVKTLKSTSPKGKRGRYAKGWKATKEGDSYIIANPREASLTHLLEFGHALRNGGRTAAQPHIAPAEQEAILTFEERVRKAVEG